MQPARSEPKPGSFTYQREVMSWSVDGRDPCCCIWFAPLIRVDAVIFEALVIEGLSKHFGGPTMKHTEQAAMAESGGSCRPW